MNIAITANYPNVLRKLGLAGFAFFLAKGILWLLAPFVFLLFM